MTQDVKSNVVAIRAMAAYHRSMASRHGMLVEAHVHMGRKVSAEAERAELVFHSGMAKAYEQQADDLEKEAMVDYSYAPRFVITCGGTFEIYWCDTQEEVDAKLEELKKRYSGSGVFPMISVMKTTVTYQQRVG